MTAGLNALLTAAGGTAGRLIPDAGRLGYAHVMTDRAEMVRTTRQQIKYGADWIKIHVTGSLPGRSGELTVWSLDELRAVTDTAHALDTPVDRALPQRRVDPRSPPRRGVDLILHASFLDEAAVEAVVEAGRGRSRRRSPSSPTSPTTAHRVGAAPGAGRHLPG